MTALAQGHDAYGLSPDLLERYAEVHRRDMPATFAAQRRTHTAALTGDRYPPGRFIAVEYDDEPLAVQAKPRRTRSVERHRKGPMGWLCATLFWAWQAMCAVWIIAMISAGATDSIMITMAFATWLSLTLPLAVLRYVTRGRSIVTTVER